MNLQIKTENIFCAYQLSSHLISKKFVKFVVCSFANILAQDRYPSTHTHT